MLFLETFAPIFSTTIPISLILSCSPLHEHPTCVFAIINYFSPHGKFVPWNWPSYNHLFSIYTVLSQMIVKCHCGCIHFSTWNFAFFNGIPRTLLELVEPLHGHRLTRIHNDNWERHPNVCRNIAIAPFAAPLGNSY